MIVDSPSQMLEAGRAFAASLQGGELVTLSGDLGAGKTLFCKGVLAGLGYQGDAPSPTFNIMNHYAPPDTRLPVIHADLYRLNSPDELDELGLLDNGEPDTVCLVEWPEQGGKAFADARYTIAIAVTGENSRTLTIEENF
jgi:tRNA threonylcarbamoyladenosine biosynthesis protein TsaE